MQKTTTTAMVTLAALGTAAAVAYGFMKPSAKNQLKSDVRNTARDLEGVKDELLNVGQDVTEMARNLKNQTLG